MPTQSLVQQTILNAEYSIATLTNNNYKLVSSGNIAIRQNFIQWYRLNIQALLDLFNIGDYTSAAATTIYDRLNGFVGVPAGATIDPNFQNQGIVINVTENPLGTLILTKNQSNLILDVTAGQYYLPYLNNDGSSITTGQIPYSVMINGETIGFTYNVLAPDGVTVYTPPRIYSFANNSPVQNITINAV